MASKSIIPRTAIDSAPRSFVEGRYPAACREFVIPAEAGIQRARLDSPVSSTGQACQARNDEPEQKTIPRGLSRGSSFDLS